MKTLKTVEALTARLLEIQRINSAASLLSWDQETYMPAGGGQARAEQISTLQGMAHQKLVSPEIQGLLETWVNPDTGEIRESPEEVWDEPSRSLLREVWRDYSRAKKLPSDFVMTLSRECSLAQQVWVEAKELRSFSQFLPNLRTVLSLKREEAEYLGYRDSPYNALLDVYEPGSTIATLRPLFAQIKSRLLPLLKKIQQSSVQIDDAILFHTFDQARQLEFGRMILIAMGYDFERGRLDLSAHPFTTSFHPTDVRVTTPAGTDVRFRVGNRPFNRQTGDASKANARSGRIRIDRHTELPAGVLRVAPIESTVNGVIVLPAARFGKERATRVRLVFKHGVVSEWSAATGQAAVEAFLKSEPGARRFREFAHARWTGGASSPAAGGVQRRPLAQSEPHRAAGGA